MQRLLFAPARPARQRRLPARPIPLAASLSSVERERRRLALEDRLLGLGLAFCLLVQAGVMLSQL